MPKTNPDLEGVTVDPLPSQEQPRPLVAIPGDEWALVYAPDPQYPWGADLEGKLSPPFETTGPTSVTRIAYATPIVQTEFERFVFGPAASGLALTYAILFGIGTVASNPIVLPFDSRDLVFDAVWGSAMASCGLIAAFFLGVFLYFRRLKAAATDMNAMIAIDRKCSALVSSAAPILSTVVGCFFAVWETRICEFTPAPEDAPSPRNCDSALSDPAALYFALVFFTLKHPRDAMASMCFILAVSAVAGALYLRRDDGAMSVYVWYLVVRFGFFGVYLLYVFITAAALRQHFEEVVGVTVAVADQKSRALQLNGLVAGLLPPAVQRRLGSQGLETIGVRDAIHDRAPTATVLVTGVSNLAQLECAFEDTERVAGIVSRFVELSDAGARMFRVDRVMVVGDVFVSVAGLLSASTSSVTSLRNFAEWQHDRVDDKDRVQLRSVMCTGALRGDMIGEAKTLRYFVSGPALRNALAELSVTAGGCIKVCPATAKALSAVGRRSIAFASPNLESSDRSLSASFAELQRSRTGRQAAEPAPPQTPAAPLPAGVSGPTDVAGIPNPLVFSDLAATAPAEQAPRPDAAGDAHPLSQGSRRERRSKNATTTAAVQQPLDEKYQLGCVVFSSADAESELQDQVAHELAHDPILAVLFGCVTAAVGLFVAVHIGDRAFHGEHVAHWSLCGAFACFVLCLLLTIEATARNVKSFGFNRPSDFAVRVRIVVMFLACSSFSIVQLFMEHSVVRNMPAFVFFMWVPAFTRLLGAFPVSLGVLLCSVLVLLPQMLVNLALANGIPKIVAYVVGGTGILLVDAVALRRRHQTRALAREEGARAAAAEAKLKELAGALIPSLETSATGQRPRTFEDDGSPHDARGGAAAEGGVARTPKFTSTDAILRHVGTMSDATAANVPCDARSFSVVTAASVVLTNTRHGLATSHDATDPSIVDPVLECWPLVEGACDPDDDGTMDSGGGSGNDVKILLATSGHLCVGVPLLSGDPQAHADAARALLRFVQLFTTAVAEEFPHFTVGVGLVSAEAVGASLGREVSRFGIFGPAMRRSWALSAAAASQADLATQIAQSPHPTHTASPRNVCCAADASFMKCLVRGAPDLGSAVATWCDLTSNQQQQRSVKVSQRPWAVRGLAFGRVAVFER